MQLWLQLWIILSSVYRAKGGRGLWEEVKLVTSQYPEEPSPMIQVSAKGHCGGSQDRGRGPGTARASGEPVFPGRKRPQRSTLDPTSG